MAWYLVKQRDFTLTFTLPCTQTPSIYVLPLEWETKFHIHTTGKIIVLYTSVFKIFSEGTGKQYSERTPPPQFKLLLIPSWLTFWFVTVVPKYYNFPHFWWTYWLSTNYDSACVNTVYKTGFRFWAHHFHKSENTAVTMSRMNVMHRKNQHYIGLCVWGRRTSLVRKCPNQWAGPRRVRT
jgi:hypothetical protein